VPPEQRIKELSADYAAMQQMFLTPPPTFEDVLTTLREAERFINLNEPRFLPVV
jgi:hypothetical protein